MGVDTMRKEVGNDKSKQEILEEIEYGTNLLNDTIEELLEYSRPVNLKQSPSSVGDVIKRSLSMMADKLRNTTVHLELEQEEKKICVDAAKMCRVIVNLVSNAVEAMPGGGNLWIRSEFSGRDGMSFLNLCISDSGCGIDEKDLERIQEPFVTTKSRGTGLGRPVCKKIVEAHNGSMSIRSKVDEGTTVEITLPIQPP